MTLISGWTTIITMMRIIDPIAWLAESIRKYQNRTIEAVRIIAELINIAKEIREQARAKLRVVVKRILRKYGYPPDKEEKATDLVIEQVELICGDIAA
jgi:hypothetical protein